jgi:indolepyruvate decarboxylase
LFQVPGNYTAQFLNRVQASGKIRCVGTINELEAGYAADAYARLRPIGVACVTYGVGSFSLYNAIAGAFVERCPVVLINGRASVSKAALLAEKGVLFAHAIDTIRTDQLIFAPITAASAVITDPEDAPRQIDRVLRACITEKKPVYIEVPDGIWLEPCARPTDDIPLAPEVEGAAEQTRAEAAARAAARRALERIDDATHPVLWGGEELARFGLADEFEALVESSGLVYTTTLLGKSLVAETATDDPTRRRPNFIGVYDSKFAPGDVKRVVENSDCIVAIGTILSDFYGDIVSASYDKMVLAAGGAVRVGQEIYPGVSLGRFIRHLLRLFQGGGGLDKTPPDGFVELNVGGRYALARLERTETDRPPAEGAAMNWASAFAAINQCVEESTYVLVDTSLALFLAAETLIPRRNHFIAQTAWLSIGYSMGAAVGVAAQAAEGERVLALVGDGGFQMVAQSIATLVKLRKAVTIVVFDNAAYSIEQFLVNPAYFGEDSNVPAEFFCELDLGAGLAGSTERPRWDYAKLAEALGARGMLARTGDELTAALAAANQRTDGPTVIAARIDPRSLPPELAAAIAPQRVGVTQAERVAREEAPRTTVVRAAFD